MRHMTRNWIGRMCGILADLLGSSMGITVSHHESNVLHEAYSALKEVQKMWTHDGPQEQVEMAYGAPSLDCLGCGLTVEPGHQCPPQVTGTSSKKCKLCEGMHDLAEISCHDYGQVCADALKMGRGSTDG